ncbi:uncharacterized protein LOC123400053 [Hordeum vulgare subsp. vulgare]|uniref:uncharacterized protein LOC123400053 n=1 Tax=Hordeum vulgare subsp. vulgare TaxID=112509 RepID=UPI001D1A535F|nr:uncharacterized protein LOC123400053 [Hordeum vulgare subsp. vulgare]
MSGQHPRRRIGGGHLLDMRQRVRDWAPPDWHWEELPSEARSLVRNQAPVVDTELLWWWSRGPQRVQSFSRTHTHTHASLSPPPALPADSSYLCVARTPPHTASSPARTSFDASAPTPHPYGLGSSPPIPIIASPRHILSPPRVRLTANASSIVYQRRSRCELVYTMREWHLRADQIHCVYASTPVLGSARWSGFTPSSRDMELGTPRSLLLLLLGTPCHHGRDYHQATCYVLVTAKPTKGEFSEEVKEKLELEQYA